MIDFFKPPILEVLGRLLVAVFLLTALAQGLVGARSDSSNLGSVWQILPTLALGTAILFQGLCRQLPCQTVAAAFAFLYMAAWLPPAVGLLPAFPVGGFYSEPFQMATFANAWIVPWVTGVILLTVRGVIRHLLRPAHPQFGFIALALETVLALGWFWALGRIDSAYLRQPSSPSLGLLLRLLGVLWIAVLLGISSVLLISKKPVRSVPNPNPIVVWLGLNIWLAAKSLQGQQWPAATFAVLQIIGSVALICRSAKLPRL